MSSKRLRLERHLMETNNTLTGGTGGLSQSLQNDSYQDKRLRYSKHSIFATPRRIAEKYSEWTVQQIDERSCELAEWAVRSWPH